MAKFVAYHDIACVYRISGQYNNIPRWLYYSLLVTVIVLRRQHWLAVGAAATCLTYGGGAAIHAWILACMRLYPSSQVLDGVVQLPNGQEHWISAAVLELDNDGALAVVGAGFLITLPMALWSSQFRRSAAKPILVLWTVLMSIGMICCLVSLYGIDATSDGPFRQYRFCHPSKNDSFPVTSGGEVVSIEGDWNSTIWKHFSQEDKDFPGCIYPCFNTKGILRDQEEITVISFPDILPSDPQYWVLVFIKAMVYGCVPSTMLFCLGVLLLRLSGFSTSSGKLAIRNNGASERRHKSIQVLVWLINSYAKILTPITFIAFVVWVEIEIRLDIRSETYHHVGQWTTLVYFGLVITSAIIGKFWEVYGTRRRTHGDENPVRSLRESLNSIINGFRKFLIKERHSYCGIKTCACQVCYGSPSPIAMPCILCETHMNAARNQQSGSPPRL